MALRRLIDSNLFSFTEFVCHEFLTCILQHRSFTSLVQNEVSPFQSISQISYEVALKQ